MRDSPCSCWPSWPTEAGGCNAAMAPSPSGGCGTNGHHSPQLVASEIDHLVGELGEFVRNAASIGCSHKDSRSEVLRRANGFGEVSVASDEHCRRVDGPASEADHVQRQQGIHTLLLPFGAKSPVVFELIQQLSRFDAETHCSPCESLTDRTLQPGRPLGDVAEAQLDTRSEPDRFEVGSLAGVLGMGGIESAVVPVGSEERVVAFVSAEAIEPVDDSSCDWADTSDTLADGSRALSPEKTHVNEPGDGVRHAEKPKQKKGPQRGPSSKRPNGTPLL